MRDLDVDSNVLIDVFENDHVWEQCSEGIVLSHREARFPE